MHLLVQVSDVYTSAIDSFTERVRIKPLETWVFPSLTASGSSMVKLQSLGFIMRMLGTSFNNMSPNGGLMVISYGTIRKKSPEKQIKEVVVFSDNQSHLKVFPMVV